ncbi:MAG: UPF0164 family protein, partial [Ignavibacteria bacterium]|nr:UPF0164 family protein [Ignavibacteria bacterium]
MVKRLLFLIPLILTSLQSQTVIGKYAGEFLSIGVGGRPLGMGGAYVAIANDVTAGYYNPAGLAKLNYPQIALMHDERYGNLVNYNYAAVAIPYGKDYTFGVSIMRLGVDGIPDTRNAGKDENGNPLSSGQYDKMVRLNYDLITEFSNQDWAFYLTGAKRVTDDLYLGANVKILSRSIAEYSAFGIGFDIGAYYTPMENLMLGANVQDVTTTFVAWSTGRNELI